MISRISRVMFAAGIILLAACAGAQIAAPATAPAAAAATAPAAAAAATAATPSTKPAEVPLTMNDNGKTIKLNANATVAIALTGNATTGFSWSVTKLDGPALEQVGEVQYAPGQTLPNVVGSGGTFVARFRPIKAGQATITMGYARPWEKETPPGKTFTVTLIVDQAP